MLASRRDGVECSFSRQHARLDRRVAALDAADIEETGITTHQRTPRKHRLGQRQQATGGDRARAIGQALAGDFTLLVLQVPADVGVGLPALEFLKRAQVGIAVVQAGDETQGDLVVLHVVQEGAAVGVVLHRPARGVQHQAGFMAAGFGLPEFLDADGITLRVAAFVELELFNKLFAQMAARALGKDGVFAKELHADLEVGAGLAILLDAQVAGGDTSYRR